MIYLTLLAALAATYAYRRWRADRRAARDMARRIVPNGAPVNYQWYSADAVAYRASLTQKDAVSWHEEQARLDAVDSKRGVK